MSAADTRMYVAKRQGRNRVIGAEVGFETSMQDTRVAAMAHPVRRQDFSVTLPRGRARLRTLSELTDSDRSGRQTVPGKTKR